MPYQKPHFTHLTIYNWSSQMIDHLQPQILVILVSAQGPATLQPITTTLGPIKHSVPIFKPQRGNLRYKTWMNGLTGKVASYGPCAITFSTSENGEDHKYLTDKHIIAQLPQYKHTIA